ncbi:MAG: cupin domain-containing protein [Aliidongia sp.]
MTTANRREILGGLALGAAGVLASATGGTASAAEPAHASGHDVTPGANGQPFVPHKTEEPIAFKYSMDSTEAKVTSGGWAREATTHHFPISTGIAGVHMYMNPGGSRELHWHAIAAEWAYILDGRCQTTVIDPNGSTEILNFGPGDVWFFPRGHGHSIQTIGTDPCHFILSFDNGGFSEHGTFSITDWISLSDPKMLAQNFGVPASTFANFPKGETYINQGKILTPEAAAEVNDMVSPNTHRYKLMQQRPIRDFPGGSIHLASVNEFPMSTTMSGGIMKLKPGALRELHWHPNANEWQYYAKGHARVTLFGSGGRMTTADFSPGDVAYIPQGYGHSVQNIGTEETEIVLTFDNGHYQEISISEWIATSPPHLLANNFGVEEAVFANFPKKTVYIAKG